MPAGQAVPHTWRHDTLGQRRLPRLHGQPPRYEDARGLANDEPGHDAERHGKGERPDRRRVNRNAGVEQRKDQYDAERHPRMHHVFETLDR